MTGTGTETALCTFGPFGVSVCRGPYGVFRWQRTNSTRVVLTDRRLLGLRQRAFSLFGRSAAGREPEFDVPYAAIVGVRRRPHPARLGLQDVLEITFEADGEGRVLSVAAYKPAVAQALAVLCRYVAPGRVRDEVSRGQVR